MRFQIDKFKIKPGEERLHRNDFDYWPAWSEHYDYEEIEDIVTWGIDKEWALSKFSEYDTGGPHPHYTILDLENLPLNNMRIFLKAEFVDPSGKKLDGFIMNKGEMVIALFSDSEKYTFSNHPSLRGMVEETVRKAETDFGVRNLFPLRFSTEFKDEVGNPIEGIYDLPNKANAADAKSRAAD